jgi:hypothetical protein
MVLPANLHPKWQFLFVGELFVASPGMLLSSHQKVLHTTLDQFFLYDFVAMVHEQQ